MKKSSIFFKLRDEEKGATMLEYSLLAVLIAVVAINGVKFIGEETSETFDLLTFVLTGF